ncbi:MAG: hypothetical protein ACXWUG_28580 [Polyangiales bacterium]
MRLSFVLMVSLSVFSAGCANACDKLWARSIANATENDVRAIAAALDIKEKISCNTPHAIRRSRCLTKLTPEEHATLIKRLDLASKPIEKSYEDPKVTCDPWREGRAVVERHLRMEPLPDVGAKLGQPYRGFDLFWDPATGESCIELRIAYG